LNELKIVKFADYYYAPRSALICLEK